MLTYNTKLKSLTMPEYGRNVQRMIDHCLTLPEKEQRNACANTIIEAMYRLFPPTGEQQAYRRKLWDHLAIMSDFNLDIDWPFEVIRKDELNTKPDMVPLPAYNIQRRHYGKNLELMIEEAAHMPEGEERDVLALRIANHMKKLMVTSDNENVEDERIFRDLRDMSHGVINLSGGNVRLHEFKALPGPSSKKKKKK